MSDTYEAPGWWLASDGRWYPPELWRSSEMASPIPPGGVLPPRQAAPIPKKLRQKWWPWATLGLVLYVTVGGIVGALTQPDATEYRAAAVTENPNGYTLGTTAEFTENGKPFYSVTATHFVNPAKAWLSDTPQAGDIFVAVEFTIRATGSLTLDDDILGTTRMYDSNGKSYFGSLDETAAGPNFTFGTIHVVPGASERGWAMFEVPGNVQVTKITFTPNSGFATKSAVSWSLPYWPRLRCELAHACKG